MFNNLKHKNIANIIHYFLFFKCIVSRPFVINSFRKIHPMKIYYGCGDIRQPGYINVDVRWTAAVDILGDLEWCKKKFTNECDEIYLSHVLEHYGNPGKANSLNSYTVLGALEAAKDMLKVGGKIRIAVPDFEAIAKLYIVNKTPLYPRLLGRIFGEQDYLQNCHKCGFDSKFLERCLENAGFDDIQEWFPEDCGIQVDSSFDHVDSVRTSLNLLATKATKF